MKKRDHIGLFFGSFNPIHRGHIEVAQQSLAVATFDRIWFVPSPQSPFKTTNSLLNYADRCMLIEKAINMHPSLQISNVEQYLSTPSYTFRTIEMLSEEYPEKKFSLLLGEDHLPKLHQWEKIERILHQHRLYVYPRQGNTVAFKEPLKHHNIHWINSPHINLSSTYIRNAIKNKKDISGLINEDVKAMILQKNFYIS